MIDVSSTVADRLSSELIGVYVTAGSVRIPSEFPCVSVEEIGNSVYRRSQDENVENHASVTFEMNVFSNRTSGRIAECKSISADVDRVMADFNFTRVTFCEAPDSDSSIARFVMRYSGVVSKDGFVYRR